MGRLKRKNGQKDKFQRNSTEQECALALEYLQKTAQRIERDNDFFGVERWEYINGAGRDFLVVLKPFFSGYSSITIEFELKSSESSQERHKLKYRTPCLVITKKVAKSEEETRKALGDFLSTCKAKEK